MNLNARRALNLFLMHVAVPKPMHTFGRHALVVPAFPAEDFAETGDIVFSLRAVKEGEPAAVEALKEFVPGNLFRFRGKIDADGFAVRCVLDSGGMASARLDPMSDSAVIRRRAEPAHETLLSNSNATSITRNARSTELFQDAKIILSRTEIVTAGRRFAHSEGGSLKFNPKYDSDFI
ncbi:hypothetical protein M2311_005687 [Rhizobium leguminosarum]|nr:hypothetical protein [Rhizobium leguminosarum]